MSQKGYHGDPRKKAVGAGWPVAVADLPVCPRWKLPVPFTACRDRETYTFAKKDPNAVLKCGMDHLCGVCGKPLGKEYAFITFHTDWGDEIMKGPNASRITITEEAPMHEECAKAALELCPGMTRIIRQRWNSACIDITDEFTMEPNLLGSPDFIAGKTIRSRKFILDDGHIRESQPGDGYPITKQEVDE